MKPKIAILTSLCDASPAYSLVTVITNQARMLKRAGYDFDLLVLRGFNAADKARLDAEDLHVRYVLAHANLNDYRTDEAPHPDFDAQVKILLDGDHSGEGYAKVLEPYDVVIVHDLCFVSWYLPCNAALRECANLWPKKRWLLWVHSKPTAAPDNVRYPSTLRYQPFPNGTFVFLNDTNRQDLANTMRVGREDVAVVYNSLDVQDYFEFCRESRELIADCRLIPHQILQTYAFSTPRWRAKGLRQILTLWGEWKKMGLMVRLVLVNAHCNQDQDRQELEAMEAYARKKGLYPGVDVVWTYRYWEAKKRTADADRFKDWDYTVPARVVRDLEILGNTFVFPTDSECCSLIQAQAAISGKFVVYNENCPQLRDFLHSSCLHYRFSQEDPDSNPGYYAAVAREVYCEMERNPIFTNTGEGRFTCYNPDWIWQNQLEPLLFRGFQGGGVATRAALETAGASR